MMHSENDEPPTVDKRPAAANIGHPRGMILAQSDPQIHKVSLRNGASCQATSAHGKKTIKVSRGLEEPGSS